MPQDPVSDQRSDPLGTAIDDTEARISALEKTGQWWPGMIAWTAASAAPAGWLIADGSDFDGDRYAALAAALGSTTLPDLRNAFPIGAGDTYALLSAGGAATHTLTGAESGVPAHTHPGGTTGAGSSHTHGAGVTGGPSVASTGAGTSHSHGADVGTAYIYGGAVTFTLQSGAGFNVATSSTTGDEAAHTHSLQSHTHTIGSEAAHTHSTPTVAASTAANAASAHSVLNPYVALTPLIHI